MSVKTGEIYKVGSHIVACGDCRDRDFVPIVIGERKVRAVITDPPYGVAYVENKKHIAGVSKDKEIKGDHTQSEKEYSKFTKDWITPVLPKLSEYNTFHIFNSDLMFLSLRKGMRDAGVRFTQMLIWLKNRAVMGRMDYLPQQELIAYGWYGKHKFERSKAKSLLIHPRPNKSSLHPTQKPIGLLRRLILNVTKHDEVVYDPFLGSGSTAVAASQLSRACIGIEIEPEYVEVSMKRLEKLLGITRELIDTYEAR